METLFVPQEDGSVKLIQTETKTEEKVLQEWSNEQWETLLADKMAEIQQYNPAQELQDKITALQALLQVKTEETI